MQIAKSFQFPRFEFNILLQSNLQQVPQVCARMNVKQQNYRIT